MNKTLGQTQHLDVRPKRFVAVDQVRGLAIVAMIMAHFGPGLYERLGVSGTLLDILNVIGRFATPTFIAVFGLSIAFAYLPKAAKDPDGVRSKLIRRSFTVLFAAVLVSLPNIITSLFATELWGDSRALDFLLNIYGVLFFYFLAILSAAFIIPMLVKSPFAAPAILGATMVMIGTFLGYDAWAPRDASLHEWIRLILVSGKYAFFSNFGFTLMLVSLGVFFNQLRKDGANLDLALFTAGIVLLFCALSMGRIVGWRSLAELYTNYDAPPQLWYLCMIAGTMFLLTMLLNMFNIPVVSFLLEHTGKNPLTIYVGHAFVLPSVAFIREFIPAIPGALAILVPLGIFVVFWGYTIAKSARLSAKGASA